MSDQAEIQAACERLRKSADGTYKYGFPLFNPLHMLSQQLMEDLCTVRDAFLAQPDRIAELERELAEAKRLNKIIADEVSSVRTEMPDILAGAKRLQAQLTAAIAAKEQAEKERDEANKRCTQWAIEAGDAKGRLMASEMAGNLEGWKQRAEAAEAEVAKLREQQPRVITGDGSELGRGMWIAYRHDEKRWTSPMFTSNGTKSIVGFSYVRLPDSIPAPETKGPTP